MKRWFFIVLTAILLLTTCKTANAMSLPNLSATTLEEYEQLLKEKVPKEYKTQFVTYDMVKSIGSFDVFAFTTAWITGDYSDYGYRVYDDTGFEYLFRIYTKPTDQLSRMDEWYSELSADDIGKDLRICDASELVYLSVGSVQYFYRSNQLEMILWEGKFHVFELYVLDDVTKYDLGEDNFLSKLLNADTAEQAVAELNERIERNLAWNRFVRNAGIPILIVVIAVTGVGAFLIIRRKRNKKRQKLLISDSDRQDTSADLP